MKFSARKCQTKIDPNLLTDTSWQGGIPHLTNSKIGENICAKHHGQIRSQLVQLGYHLALTLAWHHHKNPKHLIHQSHSRLGADV
ncbi:hypothetical protein [Cohaesibacter intestini]|uniref:hypothetical protein n=1 Tax=Cohaesibacter intestini TaxID=2211145 RepID=UPI0013009047|nr:hypothetical protein [Cohaesibacter intestini]